MNTFLKLQEIDKNNLDEWYAFDEKEEVQNPSFVDIIEFSAKNPHLHLAAIR